MMKLFCGGKKEAWIYAIMFIHLIFTLVNFAFYYMNQDKRARIIGNILKYSAGGVFVCVSGGLLYNYIFAEKRGRERALAY